MSDKTKIWFKAAGIRAVKTLAQTAVAMIGVGATIGSVEWLTVISTAGVAAILSLLTSVAGLPEIKESDDEKEDEKRN